MTKAPTPVVASDGDGYNYKAHESWFDPDLSPRESGDMVTFHIRQVFPDGSRYEGQWKDGLKHGKAGGKTERGGLTSSRMLWKLRSHCTKKQPKVIIFNLSMTLHDLNLTWTKNHLPGSLHIPPTAMSMMAIALDFKCHQFIHFSKVAAWRHPKDRGWLGRVKTPQVVGCCLSNNVHYISNITQPVHKWFPTAFDDAVSHNQYLAVNTAGNVSDLECVVSSPTDSRWVARWKSSRQGFLFLNVQKAIEQTRNGVGIFLSTSHSTTVSEVCSCLSLSISFYLVA